MAGAETNRVQASVGRQLSRNVHGSLQVAYSNNRRLAQESTVGPRPEYEFWQAGLGLSREFGPYLSMYVNYNAQRQTSNTSLCLGDNCARVFLRHVGGIGINWHARPVKID